MGCKSFDMNIYLDMDDVIVDLGKGFYRVTGNKLGFAEEKRIGKEKYWQPVEDARPGFWAGLPKKNDADHLLDVLFQFFSADQIHVLSAKFTTHPECEMEKRQWIEDHCPDILPQNVNIVKRKEKKAFATDPVTGEPNILIDDLEKNCLEWAEAGGIAVLHTDSYNSLICAAKYR